MVSERGDSLTPVTGIVPEHPMDAYQPISALANWYDYYTNVVKTPQLSRYVTPNWKLKSKEDRAMDLVE